MVAERECRFDHTGDDNRPRDQRVIKAIQCDEIWSFAYAKQKNVRFATSAPEVAGDIWAWTAIDAAS